MNIQQIDSRKNDLLKQAEPLIAIKKRKFGKVDIESPIGPEERQLNSDIATIFSEINQLVLQKRAILNQNNNN